MFNKGNLTTVRSYFFVFNYLLIFILSISTAWYRELSILLLILTVFSVIDKLGKGIVLRELIAAYSCFVCTFMPVIGYIFYTRQNELASLWGKMMPVNEALYFSFALPAMALFTATLCWPMNSDKYSDMGLPFARLVERCKQILKSKGNIGVTIVLIGVVMFWVSKLLPASIQFAFFLFFFSSFAGILYLYYSPTFKYKIPFLIAFSAFIFGTALNSGMFTVVAFMGITIFSFFFMGKKTNLLKKSVVFVFLAFLLIILQNVKLGFRKKVWISEYQGSKAVLFTNLLTENVIKASSIFSVNAFFPMYVRGNQGFNVGLTMRRIPNQQAFDNGKNLMLSLGASLVPRFLWPDKPESGGKLNMYYYTGLRIQGWSTNVGPLGEAYGSFGITGGIIFMCVLGAFIRQAYKLVFIVAQKIPLLIFWIPVLFYQVTYSAEADTLQILNSLFKSSIFIIILYKVIPGWFTLTQQNLKEIQRAS